MYLTLKFSHVLRVPTQYARRQAINHVADQAERLRAQANAFVTEISHARTAKKLSLHMSEGMIRAGWFVVLFFHVFNTVYSVSVAYVYHYMSSAVMEYYVQLIRMMPQKNYNGIIALYSCIGAVNFYSALKMSFYSLYYRRLVFGKMVDTNGDIEESNDSPTRFHTLKRFASGFAKATSARGEWFNFVLLMREVAEISSQTVQAYSSSFLISSVWMNQVFAGLIFLNTIANTLVHYTLEEKVGLRRLYSTAIDLTLDFAWGFMIPGKIIFVYISMFMANHGSFPDEFNYSDTLQIKAILECNQFFMVTWVDAVTTTLPYLSMLSGLRSVKFLIQHDMEMVRVLSSAKIQPTGPTVPLQGVVTSPDPLKTESLRSAKVADFGEHDVEIKRSVFGRRLTAIVVILMPLCGLFVLLISITSSGVFFSDERTCAVGCKLQMHPWFSTRCSCSVMEMNCFERGITGREAETRDILQSLDPKVLNSLIISHCPELVISEDIRRFRNLMTLELYNSTVFEWPSSASLSLPYLPSLTTLFFVRSQFLGGLPEGLMTNFSSSIVDVEFVASDLGGPLPDNLDEKWPFVVMLYVEHCGLQEFPPAMARMALTDLSVVDNNISVLPDTISESAMYVMLDRNPINHIPDSYAALQKLVYFSIQYTNVSSLPEWLQELQAEDVELYFRALGTPYCHDLPLDSKDATFAACDWDDYSHGVFPLATRDQMRSGH